MAHRMGNDNEAAVHNSTAKTMTIVSLIISGLVILSIFILILLIILNVWSSNYTLEDTLPYYCY